MNLHFLFLMCALFGTWTQATSFYIRPFPEFTKDAENVVRGRIHQPHVEFGIAANGERTIYTFAQLEVTEVLKGKIEKREIEIRKLGGTKEGLTLHIPGSPEFQDQEESVLFLTSEKEDHSYEVNGLELGKFGLREEKGELVLTGGILAFSQGGESSEAVGPGVAENKRSWTLQQLKSLIQSQAGSVGPNAPKEPDSASLTPPPPAGLSTLPQKAPSGPGIPLPGSPEISASETAPKPAKIALVLFVVAALFLGIFLYLRRK